MEPTEWTFAGVKCHILPLKFEAAHPMLPMVAELLTIGFSDIVELVKSGRIDPKADVLDPAIVMAVVPSLRGVAQFLGESDRLSRFGPKILAGVRCAVDEEWQELAKEKDRNYVFEKHPELYLPLVFQAGRVTFGRYFPAGVLRVGAKKTPSL